MPRPREAALLVIALAIGLAGALLISVTGGATLEAGMTANPELTLSRLAAVWGQVALAAFTIHLLIRRQAPGMDQVLLPLSVALAALGLVVIFSLAPEQAQKQMNWLWVGLALLALTLLLPRELDSLRDYRYLFALATALLLLLPLAIGREINGARLWIVLGPVRLQPGEVAKVTLVLFLAGYLEARGELLLEGGRRLLGIEVPDLRYLGPVLVTAGAAMLLLVGLRDLGTALLFFGTFVAMLYLVTAQAGYVIVGGLGFGAGAWLCSRLFGHVRRRLAIWLNPWVDPLDAGHQVVQGLFAVAAGGLTGTGLGRGQAARIPAVTTDYPFAAVCEQLGLWGAAMMVALYALWVHRALRIAVTQPNRYRALLAGGIGALIATQTLVILGGVTKLVPLTGITLPFISYGGSSLVTNFLLLGLLLRCSEGTR